MWNGNGSGKPAVVRRGRRLRRVASAVVVAATMGGTSVVGQQPALANCDIPADIRISDASVVEGTGGSFPNVLKFTVSNLANATSVDWTTVNGPVFAWPGIPAAAAPGDYYGNSGTLQLDGTNKTIIVLVVKDAVDEPNERMHVRLFNAKGCYPTISDATGQGLIVDDD